MSTEFKSCLHIEVQQKGFYAMEVYSQEALDHDRNPFLCSHISQIRVCRQVLSVTTVNLRLWGLKAVSRGCSLIGSEHPSQSSLSQTWSPLCVVHIICDSVSYEHAQKDVDPWRSLRHWWSCGCRKPSFPCGGYGCQELMILHEKIKKTTQHFNSMTIVCYLILFIRQRNNWVGINTGSWEGSLTSIFTG